MQWNSKNESFCLLVMSSLHCIQMENALWCCLEWFLQSDMAENCIGMYRINAAYGWIVSDWNSERFLICICRNYVNGSCDFRLPCWGHLGQGFKIYQDLIWTHSLNSSHQVITLVASLLLRVFINGSRGIRHYSGSCTSLSPWLYHCVFVA